MGRIWNIENWLSENRFCDNDVKTLTIMPSLMEMVFSKLSYILQMQFTSWPPVDQASILGQLLSISRLEMCGRELDGFFQYSWWGLLGAVVNFRFEYSFCVLWFYWIFIQASLKILTRGVPLSHHFNTLSHLFEHSNIVCKFFSIKSCSINWSIPIEERTKKERKQFRFEKQKGLFQLAEYLSPKRIFFFFSFLWRNLRETKDNHGKKFSNWNHVIINSLITY